MPSDELKSGVPIIRIFKARARPGKERELAQKLATTSAGLVKDKPGLLGYFAGRPGQETSRDFLFITMWRHLEGMKELYGDAWRQSLLPEGYEGLIESCSVEHYELTDRLFRSPGA
jgi:quinol monooxygenase YgiN